MGHVTSLTIDTPVFPIIVEGRCKAIWWRRQQLRCRFSPVSSIDATGNSTPSRRHASYL